MVSALVPFLASAILISTSLPSLSLQTTPKTASTSVLLTGEIPGYNSVSPTPIKSEPTPTPTKAPLAPTKSELASYQSRTVMASYPQSSYEETYKAAGAKYGVPWQILYGIHMTETGCRNGPIFNGAGSGAQGPMQFMPGTWRAYGVDGNGDNVADINDATDAIYGAANFLAKHGSIQAGLQSYGGNTSGTLALARSKGYTE